MTEHELTPSGYAQSVVARCVMFGYRDGTKAECQLLLIKVLSNWRTAQYVTDKDKRELRKREVRRNFDRFATVDEARRAYELESGKTFNEHCAKCPWCPDDTTYARFVHWLFGNTAKEYWEDK